MFGFFKQNKKYSEFDESNEVYIVNTTTNSRTRVRRNGVIEGLSLEFLNSKNNYIEIEEPFNFDRTRFVFMYEGSKIKIKSNIKVCSAYVHITGGNLNIGKNFLSVYENRFYLSSSSLSIGENCTFSRYICCYATDGHSIYNLDTKKCINYSAKNNHVRIADHVWLGDSVMLLKNASISKDSIVAARSVVTKAFDEPNIIIAGDPAKIIRKNVTWSQNVHLEMPENILA